MNRQSICDEAVFELLKVELGAMDATEVLQAFLADTGRKMTLLACEPLDRTVVKREAHSIKSSSATFGFARLSTHALELETGALSMSQLRLKNAVAELERIFRDTSVLARSLAEPKDGG